MIEELASIEYDASRRSWIHDLDARVKLIIVFLMIILVVAYPLKPSVIYLAIPLSIILAFLWFLSGLSVRTYVARLFSTLPFGLFIIIFQIFFTNSHYEVFTPVVLPVPVTIYYESVEFAGILLIKFILCISAILLLSSTTPVQEMLKGGRRLGLPAIMALSLGMMIRYLYLFADMFMQIQHALRGRNFDPFNRNLPYQYRIRTLGYSMGIIFLRAYEQGERTYTAMLCRGYGTQMFDHLQKKPLNRSDILFLTILGLLIPIITGLVFFAFR
ncbi:MAG TPA: cobalt ECF transporter T component CbiQ [Methanospirillum sp.]|nr:cobalt ECF transporter T component CbiQ [Methanospirillum sp.]